MTELSQSLTPYFALPDNNEITRGELVRLVAEEIQYLIDHNLDKLWNLLYRIDVSEKKVKEVIATMPYSSHAVNIAELVVKRQEDKVQTRKEYKRPTE
jgi:hypothetical protein